MAPYTVVGAETTVDRRDTATNRLPAPIDLHQRRDRRSHLTFFSARTDYREAAAGGRALRSGKVGLYDMHGGASDNIVAEADLASYTSEASLP